jgi:hypothetical protein
MPAPRQKILRARRRSHQTMPDLFVLIAHLATIIEEFRVQMLLSRKSIFGPSVNQSMEQKLIFTELMQKVDLNWFIPYLYLFLAYTAEHITHQLETEANQMQTAQYQNISQL